MSSAFEKALLGGGMRIVEAVIAVTPTLMIGLLIAAILRFYLGTSGTRRLFGGSSLRSLPQSWAVGMLLPVCSVGVLPILFEMRRARVKAGAMSAFALSAPLFNPLSLLYGLSLSRPYVILMFAAGSLAVVTIVGMVWDWYAGRESDDPTSSTESTDGEGPIGVRRMMAMGVYACRQLFGPVGAWTLLALLGVALLAAALPWGSLGHAMGRDDWWAPAKMLGVSIPVYATPMLVMSQLGMMFDHANSPGAAFILLVIGAGMNLGTIAWLASQFGHRKVLVWFGSLICVVTLVAYAINRPLIPPGVDPSPHTHAFDIYSNPIHHLESTDAGFAKRKLAEKFGRVERIGLSIIGFMALCGLILRVTGIDESHFAGAGSTDDAAKTDALSSPESPRYDRIVPPQVVGGTMIAGLVLLSVVMCYAFYPPPEECIKEIRFIRADALSGALSGDREHAKFWIPRWNQWCRRTEVGAFLRRGTITPYQRMQGFLVRKKLDLLEHELEHDHGDLKTTRTLVKELTDTHVRWANAYRQPFDPSAVEATIDRAAIRPDVDTQHSHKHLHDGEQSHDHGDGDFSGVHSHPHGHLHRHQPPPHGGHLVSVNHQGHDRHRESLHLEIVSADGIFKVYPLRETLGILRPIAKSPGKIRATFSNSSDPAPVPPVELNWLSDQSCFAGSVPPSVPQDAPAGQLQIIFDDDSKSEVSFPQTLSSNSFIHEVSHVHSTK